MLEGLEHIGVGSFSYTAIKEVMIPKSVKSIGDYAFPEDTIIRKHIDYNPEDVLTASMVE